LQVYGFLEKAQLENVSADLSNTLLGLVFYNTTSNKARIYDGTFRSLVTDTGTETLTNKTISSGTLDGMTINNSDIDLGVASDTNKLVVSKNTKANLDALVRESGSVYYATDLLKYYGDNGTNLISLGGAGGGGSTAWIDGDVAPISSFDSGIETKDFDNESDQEMFLNVVVPTSYTPGSQVKLINSKFYINNSADDVLFRAEATLLKNGDAFNSTTNQHISTNAEISLSVANQILATGDLDLSDASGLINGVAVAVGDTIVIRLYRDFNNETSSADEDAKFLKYASSVSFEG
jgi:hypothetical protein